MGETFLIHINFSEILRSREATNYTMFIDKSKMSIVYELIEWIRWMFSLENCIYLTHENSVIHELEDIQVLSLLKNFEVKLCGQPHCVHKKVYRSLLKNLNLIVCWNDNKVHKYFLDKINQMSPELTEGNAKAFNCKKRSKIHPSFMDVKTELNVDKEINPEKKLNFGENQQSEPNSVNMSVNNKLQLIKSCHKPISGESPAVISSDFDLNVKKDNFCCQLDNSSTFDNLGNKGLDTKRINGSEFSSSSSIKSPLNKEMKIDQESMNISQTKPKVQNKHIKPFTVGEILLNIRQDFEKQNMGISPKKSIAQHNYLIVDDENTDKKITAAEDSLLMKDKIIRDRKRQRTRKRKRSKKYSQEDKSFTLPFLANQTDVFPSNISNCDVKPNHIRFYDTEDYLMDSGSNKSLNENDFVTDNEIRNDINLELSENGQQELMPVTDDNSEDLLIKKSAMGDATVNQITGEEIIIAQDQAGGSEVSTSKLDLIREKLKRGIVIQRFY